MIPHAHHTLGLGATIAVIACIVLALFGLGVLFALWSDRP